MLKSLIIITLLFFSLSSSHAANSNKIAKIKESFDAKTGKSISTVTLKNGDQYQDIGFNLSHLGELKYKGKTAFLFRGVVCADCGADLSLFVQPLYPNARKVQFTYPGKVTYINEKNPDGTPIRTSLCSATSYRCGPFPER